VADNPGWDVQLANAQRSLFAQELFTSLAHGAHASAYASAPVDQNRVDMQLAGGPKLSVALHSIEVRLLPDTDEDRAFVNAASEMHAFFGNEALPDVVEVILRKNYNTPVYGKSSFGLENYFQLRQPLLDPRMKDETRPFDEDLVATAEVAKSRLRQHGVSYL